MRFLNLLVGVFLISGFALTAFGVWGIAFYDPAGHGANIGAGIAIMVGPALSLIGIVLWVVSLVLGRQAVPPADGGKLAR